MLKALPGVFCAGEMLDWDAPTGGYLLTASMASGRTAASGVVEWLSVGEGRGLDAGLRTRIKKFATPESGCAPGA
jgi:succinate dehydrogenase/fumarate reductase flavoprotein subunit